MPLAVTPVAGHIGAEIEGFDPRRPGADMPALLDAVHRHGVVFLSLIHI